MSSRPQYSPYPDWSDAAFDDLIIEEYTTDPSTAEAEAEAWLLAAWLEQVGDSLNEFSM